MFPFVFRHQIKDKASLHVLVAWSMFCCTARTKEFEVLKSFVIFIIHLHWCLCYKRKGSTERSSISIELNDFDIFFFQEPLEYWLKLYPCQIEIVLGKTENFDELMAAAAEEREEREGREGRGEIGVADEQSWRWIKFAVSSFYYKFSFVLNWIFLQLFVVL